MPAVIDIQSLSKSFGAINAVDALTLSINEGEMFGIVGPDGAGKTTIMRLLCGILQPSGGNATILGKDLIKDIVRIKKEIGYLSQRFSLYGDLSVDENIEFFAEINEVYDYKARRNELLEFTRLTPFRTRLAEQLSGGMKQKLALACTLIHEPKIIFLDEPTTGVDPVSRRDFWKILSSLLKSNITIVMSTPYLDEAERCSRVALLHSGKLMVVDKPQKVETLLDGEVIEIVCHSIREAAKLLKSHPTVRDVQSFGDRLNVIVGNSAEDIHPLQDLLVANQISVESWRRINPSLENVFIMLMTKNQSVSQEPHV
ncbi:MAG: ABC transporter ATP-binding protein [Bacteroidota bacterium]